MFFWWMSVLTIGRIGLPLWTGNGSRRKTTYATSDMMLMWSLTNSAETNSNWKAKSTWISEEGRTNFGTHMKRVKMYDMFYIYIYDICVFIRIHVDSYGFTSFFELLFTWPDISQIEHPMELLNFLGKRWKVLRIILKRLHPEVQIDNALTLVKRGQFTVHIKLYQIITTPL